MVKDEMLSIVVTVAFCLFVGSVTWAVKEYRCSNYEDMTGLPTKYKVFDGCYVKTQKGWFLKEQLRDISVGE